jgi:hypothetical protein
VDRVKKIFELSKQNNGIMATSVKLSLRCPLSMARIKVPIRWPECSHLQCVDKDPWLSYTEKDRYLYMELLLMIKCPICQKLVECTNWFVDDFSKMILHQTGENVDEVVVSMDKDISWSVPTPPPTAPAAAIDCIDLDIPMPSNIVDLMASPPPPVVVGLKRSQSKDDVCIGEVKRTPNKPRTGASFTDAILLD